VSRGIALLFSRTFGTKWGWGCQPHAPAALTPGKDPVPILQEAGWTPGSVWTGGKSRPHRDSIPDRPTCSQSLYRLSYPAHAYIMLNTYSIFITDYFLHVSVFVTPSSGDHCDTCSKLYTFCIVSVKCTVYPVF